MQEDVNGFDKRFRPLRPESRLRLIARFTLGPLVWVAALIIAVWALDRTDAIKVGLVAAAASCLLATIVLGLLWLGRRREARRYAHRAYRKPDETFGEWRHRVRSDIEWGHQTLARNVPAYRPLAFAPPYGNYGQDGTNDERIPGDLLGWLSGRYDAVFTQDVNARARPGDGPPLGRIQVTRSTSGGDFYYSLLSGEHEELNRDENAP
jgi:uncharacterized membrane protein YfbV (UPF0208 family)